MLNKSYSGKQMIQNMQTRMINVQGVPRMTRHLDSAVIRRGEVDLKVCEEDDDIEMVEATSPFQVAIPADQ